MEFNLVIFWLKCINLDYNEYYNNVTYYYSLHDNIKSYSFNFLGTFLKVDLSEENPVKVFLNLRQVLLCFHKLLNYGLSRLVSYASCFSLTTIAL